MPLLTPSLDALNVDNALMLIRVAATILLGYGIARGASRLTTSLFQRVGHAKHVSLWHKIVFYIIFSLFIISALNELGFDLQVLLGAAGIFTVAIGFASQTSASNLISGIFLVMEQPFTVGETVSVGSTIGEVMMVDLLSTKLLTPDNTIVRIPNEILLKTQIVNLTRMPTRRFDCDVFIAHDQSLTKVKEILLSVASQNKCCLSQPAPLLAVQEFMHEGIRLQFLVWSKQADFQELKNTIIEDIRAAFEKQKISFLVPMRKIQMIKEEGVEKNDKRNT